MEKFSELKRYTLQHAKVLRELHPCGSHPYTMVFLIQHLQLKCVGKTIRDTALKTEELVARFADECKVLSELRHPNVVQFLGVCFQKEKHLPILVMEFLPISLTECIEHYGVLPKDVNDSILYDVSLGLHYLHSQAPPIIHRDLSSDNVLLASNMTAKISDLSVAKILQHMHQQTGRRLTRNPGNPDFMPPEANKATPEYGVCLDVFSYGVMMIHVFSGQWPAPQIESTEPGEGDTLIAHSEADRRAKFLTIIGNDHPQMDLIRKCIHNDDKKRPSAEEIVDRFSLLVNKVATSDSFLDRLKMLKSMADMNKEVTHLHSETGQRASSTNDINGEDKIRSSCQLRGSAHGIDSTVNIDPSQGYAPKIKDALKELLSLASQWKLIGTFLEVDQGKIDSIETDGKEVNECLRKMLLEWLKKTDPTWKQLVDAVDGFDQSIAEKIGKKYCAS